MGGGHHWQKGNSKLFQETRNKIDNKGFIMSEDQNEVYIGNVDIFLTLFGYRRANIPFLGQKDQSQTYKIVPAYQSIYDGFVMYAGAEINNTYFENPDLFAKKMGAQFMMGGQMGSHNMRWDLNPNYTAQNDPEMIYLGKLSHAKRVANNYFLHGRVQRDLPA